MEKKQLFDSTLVGFHPEIFDSYLQISVDIGNNDYTSNFSINQTITVDDDFINNYNNTPVYSVGVLAINMTYNGDQTVRHITNFVKGNEGSYANHIRNGFIYYISINNINTVDKTIDLIISSKSDNTIVKLTTTINGLTDLTPGDFNETVTLTDKEYNAFNEVSVGEIFILVNTIDSTSFLAFKIGNNSFRVNRDYINDKLSNRSLVSFLIELEENNQATFKGNVTKLMDPDNYLAKDNTTEYTPTAAYHPATKKYVDDKDNIAKLRLYNGKISLQHGAGKSLINDTCESFADFIAIFDDMTQLDGTSLTNPFTGMTLPTNVNEFIEAFQIFQSTYNVYDGGYLVHPMIGAHASDENIIIVGFYRHNIGPAEIQFGDVSYLNWQANSIFGIGINSSTGSYVQIDSYQNSTLSLDKTLVTNLIHKINNIVRDPDRPNEYLSADGTYKFPYSAGIYFSEDNSQINNHKYWGHYIIEKNDNNGHNTLVLISDCSELFNEVATTNLNTTRCYGIGGFGILVRYTTNVESNGVYPLSKPIKIEAAIGYSNSINMFRLKSDDYIIGPCVVKYQDKYYIAIRFGTKNGLTIISNSYLELIGVAYNLLDNFIYLTCQENEPYPVDVEIIKEETYFEKDNIKRDRDNLLAKTNEDGYMSKEDKTKLDNTPVQKILTESEYAALGTAPETDNILYFITPD